MALKAWSLGVKCIHTVCPVALQRLKKALLCPFQDWHKWDKSNYSGNCWERSPWKQPPAEECGLGCLLSAGLTANTAAEGQKSSRRVNQTSPYPSSAPVGQTLVDEIQLGVVEFNMAKSNTSPLKCSCFSDGIETIFVSATIKIILNEYFSLLNWTGGCDPEY